MTKLLSFREVDLDRDADLCVQFRADSFIESFGSAERFFQVAGEQGRDYLIGLQAKNRDWPGSCVHAWLNDDIIGQIEVRRQPDDRSRAHALLYYLRPDARGQGLGEELDAYVLRLCRAAGVQGITLRVSPTNARAMAFYRRQGWRDQGPDPQHPDVHIMERAAIELHRGTTDDRSSSGIVPL